tara:strand:+ start:2558 stop:3643 length:1086 start_codon:yes stop_codon:yes gene_type:complete
MKYTEDIKRVKTIWTDEVIEYVMEQRARTHKKPTWGRIVRRLEQHYNITTTTKNLQNQLSKRKQEKEKKESENMNWKTEPATRKQCKYIAALSLPEGSKEQKKSLEDSLFVQCIQGNLTKEIASIQINQLENLQEEPVSKPNKVVKETVKRSSWVPWSKKETDLLISSYRGKSDWPLVKDQLNGRTPRSTAQKYYLLKNAGAITEFEKNKLVTILRKRNIITLKNAPLPVDEEIKEPEVADEQVINLKGLYTKSRRFEDKYSFNEMEVLLAFYEKSIDELREQFNAPFWAIAKTLENIHDLKEPHHSDLLMEAARVTKERKDEEYRIANMSRRERRKIARNAKKADRLEKKLTQLRGVINE